MWEVGGLKGSAEDGDGVVLGGDVVERFRAAGWGWLAAGFTLYVVLMALTISLPMAVGEAFLLLGLWRSWSCWLLPLPDGL